MLSKRDLSALASMVRKDKGELLQAVDFLSRLTARKRRRRGSKRAAPKAARRPRSVKTRGVKLTATTKD